MRFLVAHWPFVASALVNRPSVERVFFVLCKSVCQSFRPVTLSGNILFLFIAKSATSWGRESPCRCFFWGGFRSYAFGSCVIADDLRTNDKGLGLQKPPCSLLPTLDFKVRLKTPRYFFAASSVVSINHNRFRFRQRNSRPLRHWSLVLRGRLHNTGASGWKAVIAFIQIGLLKLKEIQRMRTRRLRHTSAYLILNIYLKSWCDSWPSHKPNCTN